MNTRKSLATALFAALSASLPGAAWGVVDPGYSPHFDARTTLNAEVSVKPSAAQLAAEAAWREEDPGLAVAYERTTGALRTLHSGSGYLSAADDGEPPAIALAFAVAHRDLLGLSAGDFEELELADATGPGLAGSRHFFWRQRHAGLLLYAARLQVDVDRDGRVLNLNNGLLPSLADAVGGASPEISAGEAVMSAALSIGVRIAGPPRASGPPAGAEQATPLDPEGISREPIVARLAWLPIAAGEARLVWSFEIATLDSLHLYAFTVDASGGEPLTRFDRVANETYDAFAKPVESPNHGSRTSIVVNPPFRPGSPAGWIQPGLQTMKGPNVHAYDDQNADDLPPSSEPSCGPTLQCSFGLDLALPPAGYTSAAVANLFYWSNLVHDVTHEYGFDFAAGAFESTDALRAEAQDGAFRNNANFATPPKGQAPRMQVYLWNEVPPIPPDLDADLDSGVIVHEYGHGVSNRLVGGPSNGLCLVNIQSPGEGISDWLALLFTHRPGDTGAQPRGLGTYLLRQPLTGAGVRPQRYSTDPGVNSHTYGSIAAFNNRHDVGSVWAQAAWEVYWALVDHWGFDPDLFNATGNAGNQRALGYFIEGMQNTICNPTFVEMRDQILAAAKTSPLHYGEDVCRMWRAFAAFGLGENAFAGGLGSDSTSPTEDFTVPSFCGAADVWVEDTPYRYLYNYQPSDKGFEPDPDMAAEPMWQSRGIWVRRSLGAGPTSTAQDHEDPQEGVPNYIHVKVGNRHTSRSAYDVKVLVYWANASTGLSWPADWHLIPIWPAQPPQILSLGPGARTEVVQAWTPPGPGHFCLLVRLVSAQDPFTAPEISNVEFNTRQNNNIAWRNVNTMDLLGRLLVANPVGVRNTLAETAAIDLEVSQAEGDFLAEGGELQLDLGPLLIDWQTAGGEGSGVEPLSETTLRVLGLPARITGIPLAPGESREIRLVAAAAEPLATPGHSRVFDLELRQLSGRQEVGGVAYHVVARAQGTDTDGDGEPDVTDEDDDGDGWPDPWEIEHGQNPLAPEGGPPVVVPALGPAGLAALALALAAGGLWLLRRG